MKYLDIQSNVTIIPYTDNTKVIKYHLQLRHHKKDKLQYFDDYDLYSYMVHCHRHIQQRGVTIQNMRKIKSQHHPQSEDLSLRDKLHQQTDRLARDFRKTNAMSSHILLSLIHI